MPSLSKAMAITRLRDLQGEIVSLESKSYPSPSFDKWRRDVRVAIVNIFDASSIHLADFDDIRFNLRVSSHRTTREDDQKAYENGLMKARAILASMIEEIQIYWSDSNEAVGGPQSSPVGESLPKNEVFVIHGHDHGTKETLARFLQDLDIDPIILHEQPNQGRTIIEKFEQYARTSYAVALLTPDDVGGADADNLRPRARQNVILEMGFFWGSLGRGRVAALMKDNLEIPSDYDGVVYIALDENDGWQLKLARELKAAGFEIDADKLL